jgi:hypothetical protein
MFCLVLPGREVPDLILVSFRFVSFRFSHLSEKPWQPLLSTSPSLTYTVGARWNRGSDHLSFQLHNGERWSASKQPLRLGAQGMYDDGARK